MKLRPEQLTAHLQQPCLPIYWLSGDEPLLLDEAKQLIRDTAKHQGFALDETFTATSKFNWQQVFTACATRSLFSKKRLIELRLGEYKLGQAGNTLLKQYAQQPCNDVLLLITSQKLEKASLSTTYMKAIDAVGGILQIWPIERQQLPLWLKTRLQHAHLTIEPQALQIFADCVEGNLLAAKQMIDRLSLLHPQHALLSEKDIHTVLSDFTHFDVFTLVDSCLSQDLTRTLRILHRLKSTNTDATLILWALVREIRQLAEMAFMLQQQNNMASVLQQFHVWPKRQSIIRNALEQHTLQHWYQLLQKAQKIDVMIKTYQQSDTCWRELETLCLAMEKTKAVP